MALLAMHDAAVRIQASLDPQLVIQTLGQLTKDRGRLPEVCILLVQLADQLVTLVQVVRHFVCRHDPFNHVTPSSYATGPRAACHYFFFPSCSIAAFASFSNASDTVSRIADSEGSPIPGIPSRPDVIPPPRPEATELIAVERGSK